MPIEERNKTVEIGVWTSSIRTYRDARKILNSLARSKKGEKINKTNFSTSSGEYWAWEGSSWKLTALKIIDKFVTKETIDEMIYFDLDELTRYENEKAYFIFDGKRQTDSSIFDESNNNNHARFKKQEVYKKYNSLEEKQNTKSQILWYGKLI